MNPDLTFSMKWAKWAHFDGHDTDDTSWNGSVLVVLTTGFSKVYGRYVYNNIYIRIYHDIIIYRYIMVYGRLWYIDLDLWAPKENKHDWKKTMSVGAVQLGTNFTLLLEGTPRLAKVNIELNNSSIQIYSSLTVWLRNEMTWKWWEWIKT